MPKQKVMLIEDDIDTTILLTILLKYENYGAVKLEINNEDDLIMQIKRSLCEVLLIDVNLNGIDGINLLTRIRNELDGYNPFVIMTSALDLTNQCMKAGADCFLQKPYDPADLFTALSSHTLVAQR
ncbi:MAG: response regulator [Anaerolineaceae bacterium]